jgi:glutathione S-transferase
MLGFKMLEPRPALAAYAARLSARPAFERASARNAAVVEERGLKR